MSDLPREILEYVNSRPSGLVLVQSRSSGYDKSQIVAFFEKDQHGDKFPKIQYFEDYNHLKEGQLTWEVAFEEGERGTRAFIALLKKEIYQRKSGKICLHHSSDFSHALTTWRLTDRKDDVGKLNAALDVLLNAASSCYNKEKL